MDIIPGRHVFYHADRGATLKESQEITLDQNNLSYFGKTYWPVFQTMRPDEMTPTQQREFYLQQIKNGANYPEYPSRLQCIFAANSIAESIHFANDIQPKPSYPIPIIGIFADRFWTLDSIWLDFECDLQTRLSYYRSYWGKANN